MLLRDSLETADRDRWAAATAAPADINLPVLRGLWSYWNGMRGAGGLPGRSAINPFELRPWLGHLLILDVIDKGRDFRYRLHGTALVQLFGVDLTGKLVSRLALADVERLLNEARVPVATRDYFYIEATVVAEKQFVAISKLVLPLATAGGDVDMLMVGIYRRG